MMETFFILGLIIIIGFIALYIYERYNIPQVLLLITLGFIIGPVLKFADTSPNSVISQLYPYISTLALILLLFDGGISLNIYNVFSALSKSLIYTFVTFILSILLSTLALVFTMHISIIHALLIGTALAGISSAIVISIVEKLKTNEDTKTLLTIESVLNDSLVIIAIFILLQYAANPSLKYGALINKLISSFSIATLFGGIAAFLYNLFLKKLKNFKYEYMLTLSVLFILYSLTEWVDANGGLAVFVFGLVFGNLKNIPSYILSSKYKADDEKIRDFQYEITFFIRTFFFTYIGLLYPLSALNIYTFGISLFLVVVYLISRYLSYKIVLSNEKEKYDVKYIASICPRGLAAAVVVGLIVQASINIPYLYAIVFNTIFLTNVLSTIFVYKLTPQ